MKSSTLIPIHGVLKFEILKWMSCISLLLTSIESIGQSISIADTGKCTNHHCSPISSKSKPVFLPGRDTPRLPPPPHAIVQPSPPDQSGKIPDNPFRNQKFSNKMESEIHFDTFSSLSEGIIKGSAMKFLIDNRTSNSKASNGVRPTVYFINGNYLDKYGQRPEDVQFHYFFAKNILNYSAGIEEFNKHTYFTNDLIQKHFIAGTIQLYEILNSNNNISKLLGIQFYPQDVISEKTLLFALKSLSSPLENLKNTYPFSFISYGNQQTFSTIKPSLLQLGIDTMNVDQLYGSIPYIPMNFGTTYGVLKVFPNQEELDELGPMDIPVFNELPLDLSVVSGVITTVIQDPGAHVNLKSKERDTPNMVLRDPIQMNELKNHNGEPIELTVQAQGFKVKYLENSLGRNQALQVVRNHYNRRLESKPIININNNMNGNMVLFDQELLNESFTNEKERFLSPLELKKQSDMYGGKASNLRFLSHPKIAGVGSSLQTTLALKNSDHIRLTPMGIAVPVRYYFKFLEQNPTLKSAIDSFIRKEMGIGNELPPSPKERLALVNKTQSLFYSAIIPQELAEDLQVYVQRLVEYGANTFPKSPILKVKVRSSSNAEDIPHFDGAGLHSSYAAKIKNGLGNPNAPCNKVILGTNDVSTKEAMEPMTLFCAIKGTYASLWNKRAIEERNFARINQSQSSMGLAINVDYDFREKKEGIIEIGNAVLVTKILNAKGIYGYRISLNTSENLVTNPTPETQSEIVLATFLDRNENPQFSLIQYAKTSTDSSILTKSLFQPLVWNLIVKISQEVETKYCQTIRNYYPNNSCEFVISDPDKPTSLDMEFKIYGRIDSSGKRIEGSESILLKQVREFTGD